MVGLTIDLDKKSMDQSDIKYVMEILADAKINNDWDQVEEAVEVLKEFLDENGSRLDE